MNTPNETRVCTVCGKEKSLSLFRKIRKKSDGTYYYKHICSSCAGKKYYSAHKEEMDNYSKVRQDKLKEWINTLKSPCIICGEADPVCIDWHHVNPNDKSFQISCGNHSRKSILDEIKKCVCLCSNCHRKVHAGKIKLENIC